MISIFRRLVPFYWKCLELCIIKVFPFAVFISTSRKFYVAYSIVPMLVAVIGVKRFLKQFCFTIESSFLVTINH